MTIGGIVDAFQKTTTVWGLADLDVDASEVGLNASPTQVFRSFTPEPKGKGKMLEGTPEQMVSALVGELKEKHVI